MSEHARPGLAMALAQGFVREAGVSEPQLRASAARAKLHGHERLLSERARRRHPGHLHERIALQTQKPPVVRMALILVAGLEEERRVDLRPHHERPGGGEPALETLRPRPLQRPGPG